MVEISVIMPVYNRADTVRGAIASVLEQDFADFELVIVDDGSEDGTVAAISQMHDYRIKLFIQSENRGGNAARNRGIQEAQAPVVCFLDSDDRYLPHKLAKIARYFRDNPDVDAVIDSFELQYPPEKGGARTARINSATDSSQAVEEAIYARTLFKATPAVSARRSALLQIGMFDETLKRRQDMDLVLRLAASCEIRSIPDILWLKNWSPDAISAKQETFIPAVVEICKRHPRYLAEQRFRRGLARDFARHFMRLAINGKINVVRHDWASFANNYSSRTARSLFLEGVKELLTRVFR
jgi:glycosyltransferase involved in cell wall biosynthesis